MCVCVCFVCVCVCVRVCVCVCVCGNNRIRMNEDKESDHSNTTAKRWLFRQLKGNNRQFADPKNPQVFVRLSVLVAAGFSSHTQHCVRI